MYPCCQPFKASPTSLQAARHQLHGRRLPLSCTGVITDPSVQNNLPAALPGSARGLPHIADRRVSSVYNGLRDVGSIGRNTGRYCHPWHGSLSALIQHVHRNPDRIDGLETRTKSVPRTGNRRLPFCRAAAPSLERLNCRTDEQPGGNHLSALSWANGIQHGRALISSSACPNSGTARQRQNSTR